LDAKGFFNRHYKNHPERIISPSLLNFFETQVRSRLSRPVSILELGSGNFSLFEEVEDLDATVTAIDFSPVAIKQAPKSAVKYYEKSLMQNSFFSEGEFDLVFDSHCMNCLVKQEDRNLAYENIHRVLNKDGIFAAEFMVQPIDKVIELPFKRIKTASELEEELLTHGFKIFYFMISKDHSFGSVVKGEEIFCDVLRIMAKK
jgi:SAM-dependent methyltransferase